MSHLVNDGVHTYAYDQKGNLIYVDNGQTTWDNYDALNRRVLHVTGNYTSYQWYEYNKDGMLTDVWQDEGVYEKTSRYYGPRGDAFAYWLTPDTGNASAGVVHYQHTNWSSPAYFYNPRRSVEIIGESGT